MATSHMILTLTYNAIVIIASGPDLAAVVLVKKI